MACSKRNNVVLIYLGVIIFSLGLCIPSEKRNIEPKYSVPSSRNVLWRHGNLVIGAKPGQRRSKKAIDLGYQSDRAWTPDQEMLQGYEFPGYGNAALDQLVEMDPTVDCSSGLMRLQVKDADFKPGSLLFVDRGDLLPLSPSKLPKSCGFRVSSTRRDFVMTAPYDGCFVLVEEACYVLPLRWLGLPVQMSCPVTPPSTVTPKLMCLPWGLLISTDWTSKQSEIKVSLKDQWEPLNQVLAECGVGIAGIDSESTTVSFPFTSPCVDIEDGMYIVKLSGDGNLKVSCPSGTTTFFPQLNEQISSPAPTQSMKTTPPILQFDMPQSQPSDQNSHHGQQPVDEPSYPIHTQGMSPAGGFGYFSYPMFPPSMPSVPVFHQKPEQPPQLENPSLNIPSLYDPMWFGSDPQLFPPFHLPHEPVRPEASPQPTASIKPEGCPTHSCPYHPTEEPQKTAARPSPTVPQNYHPFGPYHHPYPFPQFPHPATTPTPATQKPQDLPISHPGTGAVFPKHPQPEMIPSLECLQLCQVGLTDYDCCPHFSFHQHFYNLLPQHQDGNLQVPILPLPGLPIELEPDLHQAASQHPQEAPAPPSRSTFTFSPQPYPLGRPQERPIYHSPQEGNPAALPGNQPREQTGSAYFNPYENFHYAFGNLWNSQSQSEGPSNQAEGSNVFVPYNAQSSHQSDGPPSSSQTLSANNANVEVKEPVLVFSSQQHPQIVPYGTLQEQHLSNHQPSDAQNRMARNYVLLQNGPPGKEGSKRNLLNSVSHKLGENFARSYPNDPLNLKRVSGEP